MTNPPRITQRSDFVRLARQARKASTHGLVLQAQPNGGDGARAGFTVTKKVGNAVVRNRARRRLREVVRLYAREHVLPPVDLVVIGRDATPTRKFNELQADFVRALGKTT